MNNEKLFQKNILLWARESPQAAVLIPYTDCSSVSFCETSAGEPNLCKQLRDQSVYLHSSTNASEEADQWFQGLAADKAEVIMVHGVGLGYYYRAAKKWLRKKKARHQSWVSASTRPRIVCSLASR